MIRTSLVAALLMLPAAVVAAPFDGRWALDRGDCTAKGDRVPVTIAGDTIDFYESACEIASLEPIGSQGAAWVVTRTCKGEGETWPVRSIFAIDQIEGKAARQLIEIDLDDGSVTVRQSCD
jgi:hypothetical protein